MRCPNCQRDNPPEAEFCTNCGTPLSTLTKAETAAPPAATASARRSMWIALGLVGLLLLAGAIGPSFAPHDPLKSYLRDRHAPPSANYPLGTDFVGRDVLSRVLTSLRVDILGSIVPALVASTLVLLFTVAFRRRRLIRLRFWLLAISGLGVTLLWGLLLWGLLFSIQVTISIGQSLFLSLINVTIGLLPWVVLVATFRGGIRFGSQAPIWVLTWVFSMLLLAILGFLGAGVPQPQPELGSLLADGRNYIGTAPWVIWGPSVTLLAILTILLASTYLLSRSFPARSKQ